MPHLGSLFIEGGVWWTGMTDDGFFTRVASFASVVRLSLNDVTFPSTTVFARFVCALEQLEELYCVNIKTVKKRTGRELFLPLRHSSKLSHFTLVGSQVHDIIDFVVASGLSQRLTDLCLHVGSVDYRSFAHLDAVAYRDLFSACWSLRTLHLQLRDAAVAKTVSPDTGLGTFTCHAISGRLCRPDLHASFCVARYLDLDARHLEILHLSVEPHLYGDYHFGWIATFLSQVCSGHAVRELDITFDIQGETDEIAHDLLLVRLSDEADLSGIDRVLASTRYAGLENVEVALRVGHVESRLIKSREALWAERVHVQLRSVESQGILR
ncbi:hypothetical protein EVJ58_g9112 [Rhodofomes roseus]|uniref:Uncharacterized protein n=1 Tax=Rhodofomes roseus TaxID=34475 RepID=A0A4Y9XV48_9APHY|nr:hypothetical protein EVJ58_g9112 [Rhodofomes roseus]